MSSYLSSTDVYKLRIKYSLDSLKKVGKVEESVHNESGMIKVTFNSSNYMWYDSVGPSVDSFWFDSDYELTDEKYRTLWVQDKDGNPKANLSKLN